MTRMYRMLNMSKQNVSRKFKRLSARATMEKQVIDLAQDIRANHPRMGCRKMYRKCGQLIPLGRDRCEQLLLSQGFRVRFPKNHKRTTYAIGKLYYPNLIEGLTVEGLNQVWQTDITYYEIGSDFYYLVFIEDVYSRRILGWSEDFSLWAQANLHALQQAIDLRKGEPLTGLIHHSDRGGQYIDKEYVRLLKAHGIKSSMCKNAWQNAYSERLNGIIKNEYLSAWSIKSFEELKCAVDKAVHLYNNERPHSGLPDHLPPIQFETKISKAAFRIKPTMKLYPHVDT